MISAHYSFTAKTPIERYHLSAPAAEINDASLVNNPLTVANGAQVKQALSFERGKTYLIKFKQVAESGNFIDGTRDRLGITLGIRQFQFIGCHPVTVWRELRRLNDSEPAHGLSVEFAAYHAEANAHDSAGQVNAQGGPLVKRGDLAVRNGYHPTEVLNQYGEEVLSIRGLFDTAVGGDSPILTRLKQWKIMPKLAVNVSNANASPRSSVINFTT